MLLVDDHPAVVSGLAGVVGAVSGIDVVGTAHSVEDALDAVQRLSPHVVVSDVMFGDLPDGFRLASVLYAEERRVHVLFYSSYDLPWFLARAAQVGAAGYVLKSDSEAALREAIARVAGGRSVYPTEPLAQEQQIRAPSPREREILLLAGSGLTNEVIAARLEISPKTVESHLARLFHRYAIKNRTELTTLALGQGWLRLDQGGSLKTMC